MVGQAQENVEFHEFEPRDGFVVATACKCEHEVGLVEVLLEPLARTAVTVDGMAQETKPVVVVLDEPLLGFDIVLEKIAEGRQFGITCRDKPLEEFFASSDSLFESQQHPWTVG